MTREFNPYSSWLEMPASESAPSYYRLLGVDDFESDISAITSGAAAAAAKIRNARPGDQVQAWKKLLDEVAAAEKCLTNDATKAAYDKKLNLKSVISEKTPPSKVEGSPQDGFEMALDELASELGWENDSPLQEHNQDQSKSASEQQDPFEGRKTEETKRHEIRSSVDAAPPSLRKNKPSDAVSAPKKASISLLTPEQAKQLLPPSLKVLPPELPSQQKLDSVVEESLNALDSSTDLSFEEVVGEVVESSSESELPKPAFQAADSSEQFKPQSVGRSSDKTAVAGGVLFLVLLIAGGAGTYFWMNQSKPIAEESSEGKSIEKDIPQNGKAISKTPDVTPKGLAENKNVDPIQSTAPAPINPEPEKQVAEPKNTPEKNVVPQPKEMVTPKKPLPVITKPTKEQIKNFALAVKQTIKHMKAKRILQADRQLKVAKQNAISEKQLLVVDGLEMLKGTSGIFQEAIRNGLKKLNAAETFEISGKTVLVVEVDEKKILLRVEGKNVEFKTASLPPKLALRMATFSLDSTSEFYATAAGSYLFLNSRKPKESAKEQWQRAAAMGAKIEPLILLLRLNLGTK